MNISEVLKMLADEAVRLLEQHGELTIEEMRERTTLKNYSLLGWVKAIAKLEIAGTITHAPIDKYKLAKSDK
jgi:hypothetical protein